MIFQIEDILGVSLHGRKNVEQAFLHSSFVNENSSYHVDNETLEFLGDAVIGLVVAEILLDRHPEQPEGFLSKSRSSIVSQVPLAAVARRLGLGKHLKLGKGEMANGGDDKDSLLSNALEALWGALYKEFGLDEMKKLTEIVFKEELKLSSQDDLFDAKTALQEKLQQQGNEAPEYKIIREEGPAHQRNFVAEVFWQGKSLGQAEGTSKKRAEQNAALEALKL